MPEAIPIIMAIVGVAGAVEGGISLANRPGIPKAPKPSPEETAAAATKTKQNQIASLEAAFPSIQQLTGGSLSPDAWLALSQLITGKGGEPGIGASSED